MDYTRRRAFLTEPGEPLLLFRNSAFVAQRWATWVESTGTDPDLTLSTPLASIPLPLYEAAPGGPRRFSQVAPAALWHPLFWLPNRVAFAYDLTDDNNPDLPRRESTDGWAVRVCIELEASGVYDAASGTWFDPLGAAGLDVDDPAVVGRIRAWQAGEPDPVLDGIDLTGAFEAQDPHYAVHIAQLALPELRHAAWAAISGDLLDAAEDLTDTPRGSRPVGDVLARARVLADLGSTWLRDVPADDGVIDPALFWSAVEADLANLSGNPLPHLVQGVLVRMRDWFGSVHEAHRAWLEPPDIAQGA